MPTVADSAVGAILEIPPQALNKIREAQRAIEGLQITSKHAAEQVSKHWGTTAVDGLTKFINALHNAQTAVGSFKTNDININIKPAEQQLKEVSSTAQKTANDVSNAVVRLAHSDIDFKNFTELDRVVKKLGLTYKSLTNDLKDFEKQRQGKQVRDEEIPAINNKIAALREYLKIKKQSETKIKSTATSDDTSILGRQKDLLREQLNLRKQINEQRVKVKSGEATQSKDLEQEKKNLENLVKQYYKNKAARQELAKEKSNLSDTGTAKYELALEQQKNDILALQRQHRRELNKELNRTRELTTATQVSKATIGSKDESQIQRQLNNDYRAMVRIIKEVGNVKANAAKEGRSINQEEQNLVKVLWERYRGFAKDVLSVEKNYAAMGRAAAEAFKSDRSEQLARNAAKLAAATKSAADAQEAKNRASAKEDKKDKAAIESEINKLYDKRLKIQEQITRLDNKGMLNIEKGLSQPLSANQQQMLDIYKKNLQEIDNKIQNLTRGNNALAISTKRAYDSKEQLQSLKLAEDYDKKLADIKAKQKQPNVGAKSDLQYYKELGRMLDNINKSIAAANKAGITSGAPGMQQLLAEKSRIISEMAILENTANQKIADEKQRRMIEGYRRDLSEFVQNENKKNAASKKNTKAASDEKMASDINRLYKEREDLLLRIQSYKSRSGQLTKEEAAHYQSLNNRLAETEKKLNNIKQLAAGQSASDLALNRGRLSIERLTPKIAIEYAKQAKSLRELQDAYTNLKKVIANTQPNDRNWKKLNLSLQETRQKIQDIRREMGEFNNGVGRTSGILEQLRNQAAMLFSVSAIKGYINQLIKVRGEFELQQTALRAILQNKEKADAIFNKVQQMALQSPFTIMQLNTYTKQLAAYRIEADKLTDTTKMLADVSAGLGVDMGRLILAYGQVKSANYLRACLGRGTEIKTMRGIVKVEDIAVGDRLFNDHNDVTTVAELYNGTQQMYRFSEVASDGYSYRVNEAHILTMYDKLSNAIVDVRVLEYLKAPDRYMGVRWIEGEIHTYAVKAEKDKVDEYFGFKLDGNKRFQLVDGTITHNTEVRQFTEAGLNIAGELATYFSELQGRMVSVGEVMEMITKRMVRFEDVEEVFKRVTSAGGLFYDMQKKQSETLYGQMQRIQDAFSIMLNDIGKSNQGTIIEVVKSIRKMIQNWRLISWWVEKAAYAFGAYKTVVLLAAFANSKLGMALTSLQMKLLHVGSSTMTANRGMVVLRQSIRAASAAFKGLLTMTIPGLLIWGLAEIINHCVEANVKAQELKETFASIGAESVADLNGAIANFTRLADIVSDSTKSYSEQKDAMDEIKRSYGEMIGQQGLNIESIKALNGNYRELTDALIQYYKVQEYRKKFEAISSTTYFKDMREELQDALVSMNDNKMFGMIFPTNQVKEWANTVADEIASGKIPASLDAVKERLNEIFENKVNWSDSVFSDFEDALKKVAEAAESITVSMPDAENAIMAYNNTIAGSKKENDKEVERLDTLIGKQEDYIETLKKAADNRVKASFAGFPTQAAAQAALEDAQETLEQYKNKLQDVMDARAALIAQNFKERFEEESTTLTEEVRKFWEARMAMRSLELQGKELDPQYEKLNAEQEALLKSADALAKSFGVDVPWSLINTSKTTYELNKALVEVKESTFPSIAKAAVEEMRKADEAILQSERGVQSFVDNVAKMLPSLRDSLQSVFGGLFDNFKGISKAVGIFFDSLTGISQREETINEQLKTRVEEYGADMAKIDNEVKKGGDTPRELAKNIRSAASAWDSYVKAYDVAIDKDVWTKINNKSREEIEQMRKDIKAANALADDIWKDPEKEKNTGGRSGGRDPWVEIFKQRMKAVQDFYKQYETLRDKFSESESRKRDISSFEKYFESVNINMQKVISRGWDTKGLVSNLEDMEGEIRKHFGIMYDEAKAILSKGLEIEAVVNPTAQQRMTYALAKMIGDLEKSIADNKVKFDLEIQEKEKKRIQQEIDELFANYSLTKELRDLGLSVDLSYVVGGKPKTLKDVRRDLQKAYQEAGGAGASKELVKMYEDAFKKIADIEHKNQIERLKNYYKYSLEATSARVQLELKAQQEISKIMQDETLNADTKNMAVANVNKQLQQDLAKQAWKEFQESDTYINMFKDIERASTESIERMLAKLNELRGSLKNLPADQVRAIVRQMEQLNDVLIARNPFKGLADGLKDAIKYLRERKQIEEDIARTEEMVSWSKNRMEAQEKLVFNLQLQYDAAKNNNAVSEEQLAVIEQQLDKAKKLLGLYKDTYQTQSDSLDKLNAKQQQGQAKAAAIQQAFQQIKSYAQESVSHINGIVNGLDKMGLVSDAARDNWESFMEGFEAMNDIAEGGVNVMTGYMTGNYAQMVNGILQGIKGTVNFVAAIYGVGDKKKERQIMRLKESVEQLDKAYQKLEKSIERAFTIDQYTAGYNQMQANLAQQEKEYEEMIRLEEAKKKTDKDKVKEYTEALEAVREKQDELHRQRIEAMGSTTDYLSEAESWVSAWLDAYREVGDGTDALKESWDGFIDNLFLKQAAMGIVSSRVKNYIEKINAAIDAGKSGLDLGEVVRQVKEGISKEAGQINEALKELFDAFGMKGGTGEFVLSDLQKGIQNITEPQAAAIEAYLNSVRFAVFKQNEMIASIADRIAAQYGAEKENPVLTELKGIRSVLDRIDRRFDSIVVNKVGMGQCLRIA